MFSINKLATLVTCWFYCRWLVILSDSSHWVYFYFQMELVFSFVEVARQLRQYASNAVQETTTEGHWSIKIINKGLETAYAGHTVPHQTGYTEILGKNNSFLFLSFFSMPYKTMKNSMKAFLYYKCITLVNVFLISLLHSS